MGWDGFRLSRRPGRLFCAGQVGGNFERPPWRDGRERREELARRDAAQLASTSVDRGLTEGRIRGWGILRVLPAGVFPLQGAAG